MADISRRRGSLRVRLTPVEVALLTNLLTQLVSMVSSSADQTDDDPLAAMVGIGTATSAPDDPALARLFPDAYQDDADRAGEFRRYTELGLRERKVAAAQAVLATLGTVEPGESLDARLAAGEEQSWLTALNDLRLTLGTRLDIGEDWTEDLDSLADDDPQLPMYATYDWLSMVQELLVRALPDPA